MTFIPLLHNKIEDSDPHHKATRKLNRYRALFFNTPSNHHDISTCFKHIINFTTGSFNQKNIFHNLLVQHESMYYFKMTMYVRLLH